MKKEIKVGISRCLLGQKVRFDAGHKKYPYATELLSQFFELIGVCPEVESGMPIPRPTIRLTGSPDFPDVVEVLHPEISHRQKLQSFSDKKVDEYTDLSGFILKNKSPTCGMSRVKVYQEAGHAPKFGIGIFANTLMKKYPNLPIEEEGRLNDPPLRENFIERVFVYHQWQNTVMKEKTAKALLDFHSAHKLTLLAHNQSVYRQLGRELTNLKGKVNQIFLDDYFTKFMSGMKKRANRKTHTNVLMHIQGYFKKVIDSGDKAELTQTIERYFNGQLPLIVPITLLKHHLRKHPSPYLETQKYLFPYPEELMLRNHI